MKNPTIFPLLKLKLVSADSKRELEVTMVKLLVFFLMFLICNLIPYASCIGGEMLQIDVSNYADSDVSFSPSIPLQGEESFINVKIHNKSAKNADGVKVVTRDEMTGKVIGSEIISIAASSSTRLHVAWKPERNGWCNVNVTATSAMPQDEAKATVRVPVVARKLYFPWFNNSDKNDKKLRYANILLAPTPAWQEYWSQKGVKLCQWKGVLRDKTAEEYRKYLYEGISGTKLEGILIDEMGGYSDYEASQTAYYAGLRDFTQEHPEIFVGLWVAGSLRPCYCNITKNVYRKKGIDLLMLEQYVSWQTVDFKSYSRFAYFDQRINTARDQDVLSNAVMTLGIEDLPDKGFYVKKEDVEDEVRYIRKTAPEMPGVGFFTSSAAPEIVEFSDKLCLRYWISPVATIWDRDIVFSNPTPKEKEKVVIKAAVYNIGGMDAKNVKVSFHLGNPAGGGKKIGKTIIIPRIPSNSGMPAGRSDVEIQWNAESGYHDIYVEIIPEDDETTLLDGLAKKTIYVRPK